MRVAQMPDAGDPRLAELFKQVFGAPISPQMLSWKYGEGRGRCTGVFEGEQLLAHCGVTFRRAWVDGREVTVAQIGDLMATGQKPGGLSREQSAFYVLLRQVFDAMPSAANPEGVAYGFPSARAMRLAQWLGLVLDVDQMHELHFAPLSTEPSIGWAHALDARLRPARFDRLATRLWREMRSGLGQGLVGVRDAAYLRWRYVEHPAHSYRFFALRKRWGWRPFALAVCRVQEAEWELMDLVTHPQHMVIALDILRSHMAAEGASDLMLWLTRAHAKRLGNDALSVQPTQFHIIANPGSCVGRPQRFVNRWWLTAGDTDYR